MNPVVFRVDIVQVLPFNIEIVTGFGGGGFQHRRFGLIFRIIDPTGLRLGCFDFDECSIFDGVNSLVVDLGNG